MQLVVPGDVLCHERDVTAVLTSLIPYIRTFVPGNLLHQITTNLDNIFLLW